MSEGSFERLKVGAVTVLGWLGAITTVTFMIGWMYLNNRIDTSKELLEQRIHNIEDHVQWRGN